MKNRVQIRVVDTLNDPQIIQLLALYRNEFWCHTRQLADVRLMLGNTDIMIGIVGEPDTLLGFVRVLTDYVYKATIYDLIVHPEHRGEGLGALLMERVLRHPALTRIETFDLNCLPEMHPFYEKWGFSTDIGGITFMRRNHQASDTTA